MLVLAQHQSQAVVVHIAAAAVQLAAAGRPPVYR